VGIPAPDRPLAGLVSAAAEALYARLLDAGWLPIGTGPGEIDPHAPATGELLEARLAYSPTVSGRGDRLMPVAHASALKLLLARQHTAIAEQHKRANAGWDLLDSVLSASIGSGDSSPPAEEPLVEIISSRESVAKLSWELYQSTRRELIGLTHGQFTTPV